MAVLGNLECHKLSQKIKHYIPKVMLTYKLKLFNDTDEKVGYCQNIIINIRHFPYPRVICPCNKKTVQLWAPSKSLQFCAAHCFIVYGRILIIKTSLKSWRVKLKAIGKYKRSVSGNTFVFTHLDVCLLQEVN